MSAHTANVRPVADAMSDFARRTGLSSERRPTRYLWTDAFAVCNFLALAEHTGESRFELLARDLVDQVHHRLGRHRRDDERTGWLSGLDEEAGRDHPTSGGLRIGKPRPERKPGEEFDRRVEWERDGQYFHYLTRWMHALDQMARATGEPIYNRWARKLAEKAHDAFVYTVDGAASPRMYWKMSIDLRRPVVASMGHHDPLDGYVTLCQLRATASEFSGRAEGPVLDDELETFSKMVRGRDWTTADPLGLGGLLIDACRFEQLAAGDVGDGELLHQMLDAAARGLERPDATAELESSARRRIPFREFGLVIGLEGVDQMVDRIDRSGVLQGGRNVLDRLSRYLDLRDEIIAFWQISAHRKTSGWVEHRDINDVMLATARLPGGVLRLDWANEP